MTPTFRPVVLEPSARDAIAEALKINETSAGVLVASLAASGVAVPRRRIDQGGIGLAGLVEACNWHWGGLVALDTALDTLKIDNARTVLRSRVAEFNAGGESYFDRPLQPEHRRDLAPILVRVLARTEPARMLGVAAGCGDLLAYGPPQPAGHRRHIWWIALLDWLETGASLVLWRFLTELAADGATAGHQALDKIVTELAGYHGVAEGQPIAVRAPSAPRLVIRVDDIGATPSTGERYNVIGCVYQHDGSCIAKEHEDDVSLAELQTRTEGLIYRLVSDVYAVDQVKPDGTETMAEFELPYARMREPVDEWLFKPMPVPKWLGQLYPVVVRPHRRHLDPPTREAIRRRWGLLAGGGTVRWLHNAEVNGSRRDDDLIFPDTRELQRLTGFLASECEHLVCLGLTFAYEPKACVREVRGEQVDLVGMAYDSGVPVSVFCRDSDDHERLRAFVNDIADAGDLARLPVLVRELRRTAWGWDDPATAFGRSIVLHWDDPGTWELDDTQALQLPTGRA